MEEILFENEIAFKTKYDGYYVTNSGKIITVNKKQLLLQGYRWNLESVEDNQRIS